MSRLVIVEGNSNDKDNVRLLIVKGEKGADGVSPTITTSKENGIATISITDKNGTKSVSVSDGVTPTASVTRDNINKKSVITITDANGTTTADANDGVSPTVSVSKSNGVTTIEITDADGTHTATINDGEVTNAALTAALADYKLKGDFAVLTGTQTLNANSSESGKDYAQTSWNINYPTGFTRENCVALFFGGKLDNDATNTGEYGETPSVSANYVLGTVPRSVSFTDENINLQYYNPSYTTHNLNYKLVLMKVS